MILFSILMVIVFFNLVVLAVKLSWGLLKILFNVVMFPVAILLLVLAGLLHVALPVVIVALVVLLFVDRKELKGK